MNVILLLSSIALSADEPCYPHQWDDRIQSDHFWVEWEPGVIDEAKAREILRHAEHARGVYSDELGWRFTDRPMVITVETSTSISPGGRAETRLCEGTNESVPLLYLFSDIFRLHQEKGIISHELAHAVQYSYSPGYAESTARWIWWMEASATWMTVFADGRLSEWVNAVDDFLATPELALQQNIGAFLLPERSYHMYGSAILPSFIEEWYGGQEVVRATWEFSEGRPAQPLWFPDVIEGIGLDWPAFWAHFLAVATVADLEDGYALNSGASVQHAVVAFPDLGASDPVDAPQSLGFNVLSIDGAEVPLGRAVRVDLVVDPSVQWHVVLVRTSGVEPGSQVLSYVSLQVDTSGRASGWLSALDATTFGFIVLSPEGEGFDAYDYAWEVSLIDDSGAMDSTVYFEEPPLEVAAADCGGCQSARSSGRWWLLPVLLLWRRRR